VNESGITNAVLDYGARKIQNIVKGSDHVEQTSAPRRESEVRSVRVVDRTAPADHYYPAVRSGLRFLKLLFQNSSVRRLDRALRAPAGVPARCSRLSLISARAGLLPVGSSPYHGIMTRSVFVLLITGSLLACPLQCVARSTSVTRVPSADAPACRCCAQHLQGEQKPYAPESDSKCCDCLCDGALLSSRIALDEVVTLVASMESLERPVPSAAASGSSRALASGHRAQRADGAVRLRIRSLQL
jgi:hypothetical protein